MKVLMVSCSRTESRRLDPVAVELRKRGFDVRKVCATWQSTRDGDIDDTWLRARGLGWRSVQVDSFDILIVANGASSTIRYLSRLFGESRIFCVQEAPLVGSISRRTRGIFRARILAVSDYIGAVLSLGGAPARGDFRDRRTYYGIARAVYLVISAVTAEACNARGLRAIATGLPSYVRCASISYRESEMIAIVVGTPYPSKTMNHREYYGALLRSLIEAFPAAARIAVLPHRRHESSAHYRWLCAIADRIEIDSSPRDRLTASVVVGPSSTMLLEAAAAGVPALAVFDWEDENSLSYWRTYLKPYGVRACGADAREIHFAATDAIVRRDEIAQRIRHEGCGDVRSARVIQQIVNSTAASSNDY